jgi:predicted XRE-type DNA-binding protein
MNITIRKIDEIIFKKFKAKAIEEGMKIGEALTQAMELWIKQRSLKPKASLLDIKPFNLGDKKASLKIDNILYGG